MNTIGVYNLLLFLGLEPVLLQRANTVTEDLPSDGDPLSYLSYISCLVLFSSIL